MAADVEVRLSSSSTTGLDRHVTPEIIDDVRYSAAAVGGYDKATLTLRRPLEHIDRDVYPFVAVTVYDPATTRVLWDGWLDQPSRGSDSGAPLWELAATGGRSHVTDLPQPIVYVDTRLSAWERVNDFGPTGIPNATVDYTGGAGETPGLRIAFPRGMDVPPAGSVTVRYPHLAASGQAVGRAHVSHFEGLSTGNANIDLVIYPLDFFAVDTEFQSWSTSPQQLVSTRGDAGVSTGRYVDWRARLTVGGVVNTDVTYAQAQFMAVLGTRLNQFGAELVGAGDYPVNHVTDAQVVADLLGRMLPMFDGPGATIDGTSGAQIKQLAYENGADAGQILADLMAQAPTHRWAVWERNTTGQHRFEWVPWDTSATLVGDTSDGFMSPSSGGELIDTVRVRWVNAQGKVSWSTYSQSNPLLAAAGRRRTKLLDLGSEAGSADAAAAAGAAALAEGLWPTNNGTLTVRRPIQDLVAGRMVDPRELPRYAGKLIRLRDVESWVSTVNPSDRDGASVYRMANVDYSARDRAATITLDSYENTVEAALIRLGRLQSRLRRL